MKKTIIVSILCLLSFSLFAQIKKGATLVGVDISFGSNNSKQTGINYTGDSKSNNFNLSLLLGKAIKDNLFVGGAFSLGTSQIKNSFSGSSDTEQKFASIGGSVWMRKYFPVYGPLYAFVNAGVGANGTSENRTGYTSKTKGFGVALNIYPGVSVQLKKSFYIDIALTNLASISYNHSSSEQRDVNGNSITYSNNSFGASTSLGNNNNPLQLGMRWIIQ